MRALQAADLILLNGKVVTMDEYFRIAEAVAIRGEKIIAVGTNEEILALRGGETEVMDLGGKLVLPGFEDDHCHLISYGLSLLSVDLTGVRSMEELLLRVKSAVDSSPRGSWIRGHGWDQNRIFWTGAWKRDYKWPTRWDLDSVSPNNPVFLTRVCGHVSVVNSFALKLSGIIKETPDPPAGHIDRDPETGEATGVLRESAMDLVRKVMPLPAPEELKRAAKLAIQKALELGVTSVEEADADLGYIEIYKELYEEGELRIRVNLLINVDHLNELIRRGVKSPHPIYGHWLRIDGIKVFADGSLGARTAYLKEPYSDEPGWKGLLKYTKEELNKIVLKANEAGLRVAIHAIGDLANELVLNTFEHSRRTLGAEKYRKLRNRIEHCSVLSSDLIERYADLGVIASIQLSFATSDMVWVEQRLGSQRTRYTYAWRDLLEKGVKCIGGSDCPVETLNPLIGLYRIVTRREVSGFPPKGWYPKQRLSLEEALSLITKDAAYGTFEEDVKGSIEVGKLADLVVLSKNILKGEPEDILGAKVEITIVGGKVFYRAQEE